MSEQPNAVLTTDHFPPLRALDFQPVDPAYRHQLRVGLWPVLLLTLPLIWVQWQLGLPPALVVSVGVGLPLLLFILLAVIWVPRRYRYTGYVVREQDLHLRTGALWRRTTSVTYSRIQHLEVSQGPLERWLGIARLLVYTAGGSSHDLAIPGLARDRADQLRQHLLHHLDQRQAAPTEDDGANSA
ncbi:PH domain-containing protein [Natronospirillum operosum]|uniref:PH domain-containing protein n=1 Tax=Natronospirillum operosum TaxID=2759953 RepID=A0A4Z0WEF8_9GAMM|nr:PH domain-containing protein [Natronospirillum operosum]TGG95018.1 PH domain-containing protein [Natronospirillum operosum]